MANSKAPKHDFAPAWLKIPSNEGLKPPGPKSADHGDKSGRPRRDDYHGGFNRFGGSEYMYGPMQRQRSFDAYYDERRYSPQKFRHHSGDDDPFSGPYGYNYGYNGYSYDSYSSHYRNHPALFRDGKYQHPNAANARFTQMNGGYPPHPPPPPPYCDPYFYEYYPNDPYYSNYARGMNGSGGGGPRKRYPSGDKDTKSQLRNDKDKDHKKLEAGDGDGKKADSLEEEFPSLNGDAENPDVKSGAKPVPSSGVWDKGPSAKLVNGKAPCSNGDSQSSHISDGQSKDSSNRQQNSNIYKTLVPKNTLTRKVSKEGNKLLGPGKDLNSNHSTPSKIPTSGSTSPYKAVNTKENKDNPCQSPTATMDILNTRLVTTPKNLTDKKSDFLKTLREDKSFGPKKFVFAGKDENSSDSKKEMFPESENGASHEEVITNGIHDLKLGRGIKSILSSSLEAEQRLLREMGWNDETDNEEYEITEDEKREFEKLKEKRNGFKKTLPSPWSPQHLPSFVPTLKAEEVDSVTSSLSQDSDLE